MLASWSPVTTVTQSSHLSSPGAPYPDTRLVSSQRLSRGSEVMVIIMTETQSERRQLGIRAERAER